MTDDSTPSSSASPSQRLPTALVSGDVFLDHLVPDGFPEVPERIAGAVALIRALVEAGTIPAEHVLWLDPRPATEAELEAVHDVSYIAHLCDAVASLIERAATPGAGQARPRRYSNDVYISPGSFDAAINAAGAPLVALDAIAEGRARNGYALVRPPGHHARPSGAMGFCLFNNVAVATRYAQRRHGWERVLIVDYDVHHGNGTQEMFYEDPNVLYFSTHQYPWYPGSGASDEMGAGVGQGTTINVPLPPGAGWSVYDPIFRQVLWPAADRFKPDVVLLSAGFDAHFRDPLGEMRLCNADFSDLTLEVIEIADRYCSGRVVAVQEGGYDLDAVAQAAATVLVALTGSDGVVDTLGQPGPTTYVPFEGAEPAVFRWNEQAIINALYDLHGLAGYRRKARRPGPAPDADQTPPSPTATDIGAPAGPGD
jgi:acetoin utilization deacetylase AcuC-like enzyme